MNNTENMDPIICASPNGTHNASLTLRAANGWRRRVLPAPVAGETIGAAVFIRGAWCEITPRHRSPIDIKAPEGAAAAHRTEAIAVVRFLGKRDEVEGTSTEKRR